MTLELYFRLIVTSIFQKRVVNDKFVFGNKMNYDNQFFICPRIFCKDGFNISAQIHNGSYCISENGYREFGLTWEEVEFGYPSVNDEELWPYCEKLEDLFEEGNEISEGLSCIGSIGRIPLIKLQEICDKHGGIDWETTLSVENCKKFM